MSNFYENIEAYLHNELEGEPLKRFEQAIETNPALAKEMEDYQKVDSLMSARYKHKAHDEALSLTLQNAGDRFFQKAPATAGKVVWMKIRRQVAVAAAVAAMGAIVYFLWPASAESEFQRTLPTASFTEMGINQNLLPQAGKAFNEKNYLAALPLFNQYLEENTGDARALLFQGICLFETGNEEAAIQSLKAAALDPLYQTEANWCLGNIYFQQKNWQQGKEALDKISPESNRYAPAQKLLEKMAR